MISKYASIAGKLWLDIFVRLYQVLKELDICELNPDICGMEAGCRTLGTTFVCLCPDLLPAGENNSCDREPVDSIPVGEDLDSNPVLSTAATVPESNSTHPNASIARQQPSTNSLVLAATLSAVGLLLCLLGLAVVLSRRRHRWKRWRATRCSLAETPVTMQQYVTNPRYYSNAPETPLLANPPEALYLPPESVTLLEEIGEGCFGKVHKGLYTNSRGSSVTVAVKTLKENPNQDAQSEFDREVEIMSTFAHQNILKLEGVVIKENQSSPWMVFEFMQHGDLAQLLRSNAPFLHKSNKDNIALTLSKSDLVWISLQIASGMLYLSSQHFVHRDLATRNCLVGENLTVKISDFGMSRDVYTSDYYKVGGSRMLPIRWMTPESISFGKFSLQSDVWAYGVVLWEIFTYGKQPYYGHSNDEVVKLILQGILLQPPEEAPLFICQTMEGCWKTEPAHRLTFPEIHSILAANSNAAPSSTPNQSHAAPSSTPNQSDTSISTDNDNYLVPSSLSV